LTEKQDHTLFGFLQTSTILLTITTTILQMLYDYNPQKFNQKFKNLSLAAILSNRLCAPFYQLHTCYNPVYFCPNHSSLLSIGTFLHLLHHCSTRDIIVWAKYCTTKSCRACMTHTHAQSLSGQLPCAQPCHLSSPHSTGPTGTRQRQRHAPHRPPRTRPDTPRSCQDAPRHDTGRARAPARLAASALDSTPPCATSSTTSPATARTRPLARSTLVHDDAIIDVRRGTESFGHARELVSALFSPQSSPTSPL
jgi:hypothetical protein